MPVNQVIVDPSDTWVAVGQHEYDRGLGGILIPPHGTSFPISPQADEYFWRDDQAKLYKRNSANTAWEAQGGGADVVGPASSTDNSIARWDGATGKLLQNSGVHLGDDARINKIMHNTPAISDPGGSPYPGDQYFNLTLQEQMRYDSVRAKWLSVGTLAIQAGRYVSTGAGIPYRAVGYVQFSTTAGIPVPKSTIVYLAIQTENVVSSTLEVYQGVSLVGSLAHTGNFTEDVSADIDLAAGHLGFANAAGGAAVTNGQILAVLKRRA